MKRLRSALSSLLDHLVGTNRMDFGRLFRATSAGRRCWELDKLSVILPRFMGELTSEKEGYWLPNWTWPIVQKALMEDHLARVVKGEETALKTAWRKGYIIGRPDDAGYGVFLNVRVEGRGILRGIEHLELRLPHKK
jgi:hypothetical protein